MRIEYWKIAPDSVKSLSPASVYAAQTPIDAGLRHLLELRVSQINGCAYCVDMHSQQARKAGVSAQKIDCVAAWREAAGVFTEQERAAFQWADAVTRIAEDGVPDAVYAQAREHFSERELVDVNMIVAVMNAWNRIAVSFGRGPDPRPAG